MIRVHIHSVADKLTEATSQASILATVLEEAGRRQQVELASLTITPDEARRGSTNGVALSAIVYMVDPNKALASLPETFHWSWSEEATFKVGKG